MNEDNITHSIEPPQERYRTIMADPPWDISQAGGRGAIQHYPLMTVEQIKNMPVGDLAEDDAHLWLWVTNGAWRAGYDVMTAWGFTYRSPLTWVKPRLQLGQYLRNMTEHVLFGTRGRAPVNFRAQPTWFIAPVQEHSHKPEEQYAIIERVSPGPYLELFARRRQPGWDVWGNEINSDIVLPGYPVPSDRKHAHKGTDDPPGLAG
ncbi:methyltransferase [Nocardia farcinica]|uniref:MT-A70 family methyltransferase n=1 Tax=Nocardia farcinica TaxID=37329 RepID=UPI001894212D|nr:MT-A70 family methyltransferase [Nocardia farcinica]MBF6259859.1 methyltransferase [Nocardia farcinica]